MKSDLFQLIADGRTDLIFDFLSEGHEANATDENGVSVIKWCAYYGDVSAIRQLIANGEELISLGENFDLSGAAFHGHWQLVQYLLENGAEVNGPIPETGETPLHNAVCHANRPSTENVVEVLITNGADPNARTLEDKETGAFMRDCRTKGETPMHRAAAFGTVRTIEMLLAAAGNKELRDMNGDSPLTWASMHLRPASVLKLLAFGDHFIGDVHVDLYTGDHGSGVSGMEKNLLGRPHHEDQD